MFRILIHPSTFDILPIQDKQNPYINIHSKPNKRKVYQQHANLVKVLENPSVIQFTKSDVSLPDIVFTANGGLSLPRIPGSLVVLPNMKYGQRQAELPYLKAMYAQQGIPCVDYPGKEPFEGQAELKWFDGGRKAICGYGFRSTKKTFEELAQLFKRIYGKATPELLVLPLASAKYYHLDVAMLEYADIKCIVHKQAFSEASTKKIKAFLGAENVVVLDTSDTMCLNAVVDGDHLSTHRLTDKSIKPMLEMYTGYKVFEVDTSEFERSGGSVRCMILDIYS